MKETWKQLKKGAVEVSMLYAFSWYFNNFVAGYFRIDSLYYFEHSAD